MKKVLIILRGCPGSGKSTVAEILAVLGDLDKVITAPICCADDYHMVDGEYKWDPKNIGAAHKACKDKCEKALSEGVERVIVANTNTSEKEINPYIKLAEKYGYMVFSLVVENRHGGVNEHGVPEETLIRMEDKIKNSLKLR
jgi:predicted kinase